MALPATRPTAAVPPPGGAALSADQLLEIYYYLRLTRTLEERLVALYRQTKVIGGLFRSLGQEGESVATAYALERGRNKDILSPLIRNLGSLLVMGAQPIEILRQYMAKADSPTHGRELNVHFNDLEKGYLGQISHLGDMIPVMAGIALSFKLRGELRVGLVYIGDGGTSTGTFHEGLNLAAVQRLPLVVIGEYNHWAYSTPPRETIRREGSRREGEGLRHRIRDRRWERRVRGLRSHEVRRGARAARQGCAFHRSEDVSTQRPRRARRPALRAEGRARALVQVERSRRSVHAACARGGSGFGS